jgi:hypothetical protein
MRFLRLDLPGMTGLIPSFPRKARNASVSWPPERSASNALDARRVAEGVGQKFLDAGDQADAFLRHDTVGGIAGRAGQHPRPSIRIDDGVDFAVAAAHRPSASSK